VLHLQKLLHTIVMKTGFWGILVAASIPNPLFDLAGITCGHFLVFMLACTCISTDTHAYPDIHTCMLAWRTHSSNLILSCSQLIDPVHDVLPCHCYWQGNHQNTHPNGVYDCADERGRHCILDPGLPQPASHWYRIESFQYCDCTLSLMCSLTLQARRRMTF
jgi:hypothetical protein